jgi:hypothetical protein
LRTPGLKVERLDATSGQYKLTSNMTGRANSSDAALIAPDGPVERRGDSLYWQRSTERRSVPLKPLIWSFARVESDAAIQRFVEKYGGIGICEHNLPASHHRLALGDDSLRWQGLEPKCPPCSPQRDRWGAWREPLEVWRGFANEARCLLHLTEAFRKGEEDAASYDALRSAIWPDLGAESGWAQSAGIDPTWSIPVTVPNVDDPGIELYGEMVCGWVSDRWLCLGNVRPKLTVVQDNELGPRTELSTSGEELFGALAIGLAAEVSRLVAAAPKPHLFEDVSCTACGRWYVPARRPSPGRRNYCPEPECRRTAANRDAQRDRRQRQAKENEG